MNGYPIIGEPFVAPESLPSPATENPSIQEVIPIQSTTVDPYYNLKTTQASTAAPLENANPSLTTSYEPELTTFPLTTPSPEEKIPLSPSTTSRDVPGLSQPTVASSTAALETSSPMDITTSLPVKAEASKDVDDSVFEHFSLKPQVPRKYLTHWMFFKWFYYFKNNLNCGNISFDIYMYRIELSAAFLDNGVEISRLNS
jgi:hypothetical protein